MAVVYVHSPVEVIIPSDNGVTVDIPLKAMVVPVPSGARGLPGYSPTVTTESIEGGTEVTIHYEDGEVTFDVMNGEQGEPGEPGEPGEGVASGGTTGQVLKKRSNTDYDTEWGNLPTVPTKVSDLTNDSGFVNAAGAAAAAPVQSVNGQTGAVSIPKPSVGSVSLSASWSGSDPYTQTVTVSGVTVTANSKVDIQPDASTLQQLIDDGVSALYIVNNNGTLTAYAIGAAPSVSLTIQVVVTEVDV